MRSIRSFLGLALASAAVLSGCGGEARDATSKELAALTAEISKLRAQQAQMGERLDALERDGARPATPAATPDPRAESAAPAARTLDDDRPALDVVRLGPASEPAERGDGDVDDEGPRTVLRSGAGGIIVEETGPAGTTRVTTDGGAAAKKASKKSDRADRKKTASLPTP